MKVFVTSLKISLISLSLLTVLTGIVYPLVVFGIGQVFFRREANGSLFVYQNGKVLGSELIGQSFTKPFYFHSRPSAAGNNGYDASNSSGSNLGPTSQKLFDAIQQRVTDYRKENKISSDVLIPGDAVTASGSGLDPHISVANALLQAPRVAGARGMNLADLEDLIEEYTEGRFLWLLGEDRINVLRLNLALDKSEFIKGSNE